MKTTKQVKAGTDFCSLKNRGRCFRETDREETERERETAEKFSVCKIKVRILLNNHIEINSSSRINILFTCDFRLYGELSNSKVYIRYVPKVPIIHCEHLDNDIVIFECGVRIFGKIPIRRKPFSTSCSQKLSFSFSWNNCSKSCNLINFYSISVFLFFLIDFYQIY